MSDIQPFAAYRPPVDKAKRVASPPYDVLSPKEAAELAGPKSESFLRVTKPEIDFLLDGEEVPEKGALYEKAAENLRNMMGKGLLKQDETAQFYLYQQQMGSHVQTGVVCGASVDEYDRNRIKKHEQTRPDKEDDRTQLTDHLNANTGPVFLTYKHREHIDKWMASFMMAHAPEIDFQAEDAVYHRVWPVSDATDIDQLQTLFQSVETLYIADGHHRAACASRVRKLRKDANPGHNGTEAYNHFLAVLIPDNQIHILDYNRCLLDLNGNDEATILEKMDERYEIEALDILDAEDAKPQQRGDYALYLDQTWYRLRQKEQPIRNGSIAKTLDAALLQNDILNPIFGIENPRLDKRIDFIGGIRGLKELEKRCREDAKAAIALYPTGIDQLIAVSDAGELMPPKSTWFEPKLRSGLFVRTF